MVSLNTSKHKKIKKTTPLISRYGSTFIFFALISFFLTLILAFLLLVLFLGGVKIPLHDFLGDILFPCFRRHHGIIPAFCFLFALILCLVIILYFLYFLLRSLKSPTTKQAFKYLTFLLSDLAFLGFLTYYCGIKKGNSPMLKLLPPLVLIPSNGFLLHYFLSKPVVKLLHAQYPDYFPIFFDIQPGSSVKAVGFKIITKKPRSTS